MLNFNNRKRTPEDVYRENKTRHLPEEHATGTTIKGRVFLFCPVGNICSWSAGDVEHKFCAYCDKFFDEILRSESNTLPDIKSDPSLPMNKIYVQHPDGRKEEFDI